MLLLAALAVLVVAVLILVVRACSNKPSTSETQTATQAPTAQPTATPTPTPQPTAATSKLISVTPLNQAPELATGCEITSLTVVLNYYGYPADKCDLSDNYLTKGAVGTVDFHKAFEGDPRDDDAFGCYAPVIVDCADRYLKEKGSSMTAKDLTGTSFTSLYDYIDKGTPVIVWATRYMEQGHYSVTWNVDGKSLTWFTPEHCLVLVGYNKTDSTVLVADPLVGEVVSYDEATFNSRYNDLGEQALILQ